MELLKQHGPSLKRPLVGEITASKIKNMKESGSRRTLMADDMMTAYHDLSYGSFQA